MQNLMFLIVPSKRSYIKIARSTMRDFLLLNGFPNSLVVDMEIVLGELLANVIKHTYKGDETKKIIVSYVVKDGAFYILVRDFGDPVDPTRLKPIPPDLKNPREGGYGLYIIHQVVDDIKIRPLKVGNLTIVRKDLR
ncbi:anti-sigma regulatory factor [Thermotoga sp. SG1]|uniref:ATP-binding protein n=1 Tax=Thermotoga sp. SG1 TaxID=126739 RepID=UPI000C770D0E|nr:anti-sigma regulatory factor [Thermotoga sp. SG1]PLV56848.1 serine/threonine protein kinase [Thermotoga sp. SG1]